MILLGDVRFESNVDKVIQNFKKMTKLAEIEGIAFVNDSMNKIITDAKPLTPIKSGDLRRGYRVNGARLVGKQIIGSISNTEKYFKYVEEGHRTRNGGFVKGRFMLTRANKMAHASYIPRRFKQMSIRIIKKG